ncbi:MAG: hypothetical protein LRZ84_22875 [Desertifilum sp.]|nr:hypothetical protein [Desertifilum sp.]
MSHQHYRLTLLDAIAHYQQGDLTAKGLLHFYLKIRLKPGWTLKETQKEICETLGISRAAFYSALSKLKAEGSVNWSAPANTRFSISLTVCERGQESTIVDEESTIVDEDSTIVDAESTIVDEPSTIVDNKRPEPLPGKASSAPSDFFSNSFQAFFNSLSEETKESFLKFSYYEASRLPKAVVLVDSWIAKNHAELWQTFIKRYPRFNAQEQQPPSVEQSSATATAQNPVLGDIQEAIAQGRLHPKQNLIERGFVVLPNGDAMHLSEWLEG